MDSDGLVRDMGPIVPAQWREIYARRSLHARPELRLMLAVMEDAIACYLGCALDLHGKLKREQEEKRARAWFESDDESSPFCFVPLCAALEISVSALREALAQQYLTLQRNFRKQQILYGGRLGALGHNTYQPETTAKFEVWEGPR